MFLKKMMKTHCIEINEYNTNEKTEKQNLYAWLTRILLAMLCNYSSRQSSALKFSETYKVHVRNIKRSKVNYKLKVMSFLKYYKTVT